MSIPTAFVLAALAVTLLLLLALRDASAGGMTFNVDTTSDDLTKQQCDDATPNDCSLRGAVNKANFSAGVDTIVLDNNETYPLTLTGADEDNNATGDLDIQESVTIEGHGSTIDATGLGDRVMELYPQLLLGVVSFNNFTMTGGNETTEGGGGLKINNAGASTDIQLTNVTISGNHTDMRGGGLYVSGDANVTITNSHVNDNTASLNGGGLYESNGNGSLHTSNSTFNGNIGSQGGGIELEGASDIAITNTSVNGNTANVDCGGCLNGGGGIYIGVNKVAITDGQINGNHADQSSGGGVYAGGTFTLDGTAVHDNTTGAVGGGLVTSAGTISNASIVGNTAVSGGGVFVAFNGTVITNSVIRGNMVTGDGGGIDIQGTTTIDHTEISGNSASLDGGGIAIGGSNQTITNSTISGNSANKGGGIGRSMETVPTDAGGAQPQGNPVPGKATLSFVTLANNAADVGASIYNDSTFGTIDVGSSIIAYPAGSSNCNPSAIGSKDYNVEGGASCSLSHAHDISGVDIDPKLDTLKTNGATTKTHALKPGSPAVDLIPAAACSVDDDQRGISRPHGPSCDAGAFESNISATITPSPTPTPSATPAGPQHLWGDVDCNTLIRGDDATAILAHVAGVGDAAPAGEPCPVIGDPVLANGVAQTWGDNNCSDAVDPVDALYDLIFASLLTPTPVTNCPHVGDETGIVPQ